MIDITQFNEAIADGANWPDADDDLRNWFATQHGKYFAGIEAKESRLRLFLCRVVGRRCPCCGGWSRTVTKRRRLSSYNDDTSNWLVSCRECFDEDTYALQGQWDDYYSGRF
jgi:hypothetical protein